MEKVGLLLLLLVACKPSNLTEEEATAAFEARMAKLERVTMFVTAELAKHEVNVKRPPPCADRAGGDAAARACKDALELQTRRNAAFGPAIASALTGVADEIGAIGITGVLTLDNTRHAEFEVMPCRAFASTDWSVGLDRAVTVGPYRLTWSSRFRTAYEQRGIRHGDGDVHPAIAATWSFPHGGGTVELTACFVLDGTPRPK